MSLVGSLEDLGLGDILQIISLSRKSGVLLLRSDHGEGSILFREGRVQGAICKGAHSDLRSLLVSTGQVSEGEFAAAAEAAQERGVPLERALCDRTALSQEAFEEQRRKNVENAVFTMFSWPSGEFSFDVREDLEGVDAALCVDGGIDAQYLAMEGARLRDESGREEEEGIPDSSDPSSFADLGAELRAEDAAPAVSGPTPAAPDPLPATELVVEVEAEDDPAATEAAEAAELVAEATLERVAPEAEVEAVEVAEVELERAAAEAAEVDERDLQAPPPGRISLPAAQGVPIIVVDPQLAVLEWAKAALSDLDARVHIFPKTELAIARIRQYLGRAETPLVVLAEDAPPDPISGARTAAEIVDRLHAQAPRMPIVGLRGAEQSSLLPGILHATRKPLLGELANPKCADRVDQRSQALRDAIRFTLEETRAGATSGGGGLRRLKELSARLRERADRGEVLPAVLEFAAEQFRRVALFLVRENDAVGMAQRGLTGAGGPDDSGIRALALPARDPAWFRAVLERGSPVRAAPSDDGDLRLAALLGGTPAEEAYVAPLESGDRIVALLYADNLPEGSALGDTTALEVMLHEAGLALDRAALARQLAELEGEG